MFIKPLYVWVRTAVKCSVGVCGFRLCTLGHRSLSIIKSHPLFKNRERTVIRGLLTVWISKGPERKAPCFLWRASWVWACLGEGHFHSESEGHDLTWFMDPSLLFDAISNALWEIRLMSLFKLSKACPNYADLGQILWFLLSFPLMELMLGISGTLGLQMSGEGEVGSFVAQRLRL